MTSCWPIKFMLFRNTKFTHLAEENIGNHVSERDFPWDESDVYNQNGLIKKSFENVFMPLTGICD